MRKTHRSLSSSLELLESRIAPASITANSVGGVLKINALTTGVAASFGLLQSGPTEFTLFDLGEPLKIFTGIKAVQINLGDLNDTINLGTSTGVPAFKGPVVINTEAGADAISFTPTAAYHGTVTINSDSASNTTVATGARFSALKITSPGGALLMSGAAETVTTYELNYVSLENNADIKRALIVNALESLTSTPAQFFLKSGATVRGVLAYYGGNANDQLNLEGSVLGKTAIKLGAGANSITTQSFYRTASLAVTGGPGPDTVTFNGDFNITTIGGATSLSLGNGNNSVLASSLRAGGVLKIIGGVNNDNVNLQGGILGGVIQAALGDGNNSLMIGNSALVGGGLKVTTGIGNDTVNVGPASIMGATRLVLGAGTNVFGNQGGGGQFEGGFAYVGLGGTDQLTLGGAVVKGSLSLSVGDGNNTVSFLNAQVHGATQFKGGNDALDNFIVDSLTNFSGALTLNPGNGTNALSLQGMSNITTLTYNGGSGVDNFQVLSNTPISGAGFFTRAIVKLGAGADTVNFGAAGFLSFKIDGGADVDQITGSHPDLVLVNFTTGI